MYSNQPRPPLHICYYSNVMDRVVNEQPEVIIQSKLLLTKGRALDSVLHYK